LGFDIIALLKFIFLGLVQGITEVLPISSSGHVELMKALIGLDTNQGLVFLIILNTGSFATFVIIYFKKIMELSKSLVIYLFVSSQRAKHYDNFIYASKILVACIPAGIFGLLLNNMIENFMIVYNLLFVSIGLLTTATVLYFVSGIRFRKGSGHLSWLDILFVGLAQAVAIFPGISRSGMTTSTALKRGSGITAALNFSFMIYIPISFATILLMIFDFTSDDARILTKIDVFYYFFAFVAAMIATFIAYKLIFNIFRSGKLKYFSYYCFGVGFLALLLYVL